MTIFKAEEIEGNDPGVFRVVPSKGGKGILCSEHDRSDQVLSLDSVNVGERYELLTEQANSGGALIVEIMAKEGKKLTLSSQTDLGAVLRS